MEFGFLLYYALTTILFTSTILASDPNSGQPPALRYPRGDNVLKIPDKYSKQSESHSFEKTNTYEEEIEEKMSLFDASKRWWPLNVGASKRFDDIPEYSSSETFEPAKKKSATFDELEDRNANVYNPLLNLDRYRIPFKKYTFEELENMNANRYNPHLN